ncbi:discoidin domain-containing protein [Micromonospora sp. NBC_01813]|uniref:discoidin domain-containing protein n=1 Tax=Micromonospora sp. NBC_01813 TaxID=2975988 RepID=UPI002DD8E901|nr:discoidin domain-containing protein [Micromonospora sp. NBC_01813]WSA07741.1 discoidin domain-containing protein [Micromonospora sp. NBC_01813]
MNRPVTSGSATLRWLSDTVAIVGAPDDGAIAEMARSIPTVAGVVTVVGHLGRPQAWQAVAEALPIAVPPRTSALLAVAGAGAPDDTGRVPAAVLAEQLGSDVLAPAGRLLLVPGAALFAVDGFRRFAPAAEPVAAGLRHPTPGWAADIDALPAGGDPGLVRVAIPAGVWVHPHVPDLAAPGLDDLAYAIPVDVDRPVLLVGRPGCPPPEVDEVLAVVDALPARLRTRLIVVPYGSGAQVCRELTQTLSDRWRCTVTMSTGLPTLDAGDRPISLAVETDPSRCWPQPVRQLAFPPSGVPRPVGPVDALASLAPAGSAPAEVATYRLNERWVVEAVQCGLWVRPPFVGRHGPAVRARAWQPGRLEIVVGVPGVSPSDDVRPVLHELLARLPAAARQRVVVTPPEVAVELGLGPRPGHDTPDIALVDDGSPDWWRTDPRLFTVLVGAADGDRMVTQAGEVGPSELGELVAAHGERGGRPILLISADPVPREFCQRLADQVQAVVISGGPSDDGWLAVPPRRTGRDESGPIRVPGPFPFLDHDLAAIAEDPVPVLANPSQPAGGGARATLDLRIKQGTDGAAREQDDAGPPAAAVTPSPLLVVGRGPDAERPFRLFGIPAGVWFVATAVATQRPEWTHRDCLIRLDVEEIDQANLQLLANYLGAELTVPADRLRDHPTGGEGSERWQVHPRRPESVAGDPGRAQAELRRTGQLDLTAGIARAIALRGLPGIAVPADLPEQATAELPDGAATPDADDVPAEPDLPAKPHGIEPSTGSAGLDADAADRPDGDAVDRLDDDAADRLDDDAADRPDGGSPLAQQAAPALFWRLPDPPADAVRPAEVFRPATALPPAAVTEPLTEVNPTWGPTLQLPVADPPPVDTMTPSLSEPMVRSQSEPMVRSQSEPMVRSQSEPMVRSRSEPMMPTVPTVPIRLPTPDAPSKVVPSRRNLRAVLVAAAFVAIVAVASGAAAQIGNRGGPVADRPQPDSPATSVPAWSPAAADPDVGVSVTPPAAGAGSAPATAPSTVAVARTEPAPKPTTAGPPTPTRTTAPAPTPAPVRTTAAAPVSPPVTGRTNATGRNLALGAAVSASSSEGANWAPRFALDGDRSTRWASTWQDPQWIRVDLGENWIVTEVRLAWESAYATAYRVEVSRDGVNWTRVFATSSGTGGTVVVDVPSVVARHVRVYGTSRSGGYGYSLYEFEVR